MPWELLECVSPVSFAHSGITWLLALDRRKLQPLMKPQTLLPKA